MRMKLRAALLTTTDQAALATASRQWLDFGMLIRRGRGGHRSSIANDVRYLSMLRKALDRSQAPGAA